MSPNQTATVDLPQKSDTNTNIRQSRNRMKEHNVVRPTPSESPRIRFDPYDYHRGIPSRHDLQKKGYYEYLEKQALTPPSVENKRDFLKNIATTTRQKLVT